MCKIIYEDNHLLVLEKPPNLLTQADATGDDCLVERMKRYIAEKYAKPGAVYLGLVHRMDRPVGGLVVLARTSKAAARLSEQLRSHAMQREYLAVVHGCDLPEQGTLRDFLWKDEAGGSVLMVSELAEQSTSQDYFHKNKTGGTVSTSGAKEALLHFSVLERDHQSDTALLHIQLETGRKHQIRVQLAEAGLPIWGDARYGGGKPGQQIALWAARVALTHPVTREWVTFEALPPRVEPWTLWRNLR